mgnify:CR=1 FL=1
MEVADIVIDTSYWKLNDPEWLKQREQSWKPIKQWFDQSSWLDRDDFKPEEESNAYFKFYIRGELAQGFTHWMTLALLHPEPTVENIKEMLSLKWQDYDGCYMLYTGEPYYSLVEKGLLDNQVLENLFVAFCGKDYEEMAQRFEFDPFKKVPVAVNKLLPKISTWLKYPNPSVLPIELLVRHLKAFLKYIKPETMGAAQFRLNRFCELVGEYKPKVKANKGEMDAAIASGQSLRASTNPELQTKIAKEIQAYLLSTEVHPCVNEVAKQYIQLES